MISVKLVNLFELFSSTKFVYAAAHNHQYIFLLLEIFNNIIQYQYPGTCYILSLFHSLRLMASLIIVSALT